jgi:hypothetical protein
MSISRVFGPSGGSGIAILAFVDLSSQIDNSNQIFTLPPFKKGVLIVYYNGLGQRIGTEITETSNTTFTTTFVAQTGSSLFVYYQPL